MDVDERIGKIVKSSCGIKYQIHAIKSGSVFMRDITHIGGMTQSRECDLGNKLEYIELIVGGWDEYSALSLF